ncbi:MAG: hypothetical protein AMXMBFR84_19400 [Candidatus Hydrogenedentota bacterium]
MRYGHAHTVAGGQDYRFTGRFGECLGVAIEEGIERVHGLLKLAWADDGFGGGRGRFLSLDEAREEEEQYGKKAFHGCFQTGCTKHGNDTSGVWLVQSADRPGGGWSEAKSARVP